MSLLPKQLSHSNENISVKCFLKRVHGYLQRQVGAYARILGAARMPEHPVKPQLGMK